MEDEGHFANSLGGTVIDVCFDLMVMWVRGRACVVTGLQAGWSALIWGPRGGGVFTSSGGANVGRLFYCVSFMALWMLTAIQEHGHAQRCVGGVAQWAGQSTEILETRVRASWWAKWQYAGWLRHACSFVYVNLAQRFIPVRWGKRPYLNVGNVFLGLK